MKKIIICFMIIMGMSVYATQPTQPESTSQDTGAPKANEYRNQELENIDGSKSRGFDKALDNYLNAYNRDSNLIFALGNEYFNMNYYEKAFKVFSSDMTDTRNLFGAATTARLMGDYAIAVQFYNRVLDRNSGMSEAYLGRGMANRGLQNYDEAVSDLTQYLKYKKDENVYMGIAGIYIKTEQYKNAKDILETGMTNYPGSKNIKSMLNMVKMKIVQ